MSNAETKPFDFDPTLLEPASRVGHYELIDHMTTTEMSVVYAAKSLETEEPVALKLPLDECSAEQLREEIKIHARFSSHPSIVTIDGCGVWKEQPFLATRLQEGGTLNDDIEVTQTNTPGSSSWINSVLVELEAKMLNEDEDCRTNIDEIYSVASDLYKEGLANIITSDTEAMNAEDVVVVVADAAKVLGHDLLPGSPAATAAAKLLLEKEASRASTAETPDYDMIVSRTTILKGIALGVEALNKAGVVHADIKARNAAINRQGDGRLIDFGIAAPSRTNSKMQVLGSIGNIPPEGYQGYLTAQNDAFALAVTAFRALSGVSPHVVVNRNPEATFKHLIEDTVTPLSEINDRVPPGLGNVIMWGLAKDPADRATTSQLRQAFELHC